MINISESDVQDDASRRSVNTTKELWIEYLWLLPFLMIDENMDLIIRQRRECVPNIFRMHNRTLKAILYSRIHTFHERLPLHQVSFNRVQSTVKPKLLNENNKLINYLKINKKKINEGIHPIKM